ncbi:MULTISPECIES: hypothetical protein [unclassified Kitasatospora]|uniref:hypothetical protein n=1 Tax=unclassified Kitasatospora TaxID=2633591 RepID=UPI0024769A2C|nr:hypothetical protein [Kitasatospora sp. GAS204B]
MDSLAERLRGGTPVPAGELVDQGQASARLGTGAHLDQARQAPVAVTDADAHTPVGEVLDRDRHTPPATGLDRVASQLTGEKFAGLDQVGQLPLAQCAAHQAAGRADGLRLVGQVGGGGAVRALSGCAAQGWPGGGRRSPPVDGRGREAGHELSGHQQTPEGR